VYNQRKKIPLQFPLSNELFERAKMELEMMDKKIANNANINAGNQVEFSIKSVSNRLMIAPEIKALIHMRLN